MPKTTSPRRQKVALPGPGYTNRPFQRTESIPSTRPADKHRSFARTESAASTKSLATEHSTSTEDSWSPVSNGGLTDSQFRREVAAYDALPSVGGHPAFDTRSVYPSLAPETDVDLEGIRASQFFVENLTQVQVASQQLDEMRLERGEVASSTAQARRHSDSTGGSASSPEKGKSKGKSKASADVHMRSGDTADAISVDLDAHTQSEAIRSIASSSRSTGQLYPWLAQQGGRDHSELVFKQDRSGDDCRAYRIWGADRFLWLTLSDDMIKYPGWIVKRLKEDVVRRDADGSTIRYRFFGSTDSKLKKSPTIGYFEERPGSTVYDLLNSFGDLQSILEKSGPGKYIARLSLSFSSTISAGELHDNQVMMIPDIENAKGTKIFSDGCGVISEQYAEEIARQVLKLDYVPSIFQFRRGGKKGILVKYAHHELVERFGKEFTYKTVGFRPSQHKYDAPGLIDLEINSWSRPRPIRARLTRFLILILDTLATPYHVFQDLLEVELRRLQMISSNRDMALRYLEHDEGASMTSLEITPKTTAIRMLNAGIEMHEPYLQEQLRKLTAGNFTHLRKKINIPIQQTVQLFGCIDESRKLAPNDVYVHVSGIGYLEGKVMVTRSPCGHPGDVRVITAKRPKVDPGYRDCVVFSARGDQPIPDMCSGGDLDGDEYLVSWNPLLIPPKQHAPDPRGAEPKAKVALVTTDPIEAMQEHISRRCGTFDIGNAASAWENASEFAVDGVCDPFAIANMKRYEVCLDVNKAGTEIPPEPDKALRGRLRKQGPISRLRACINEEAPPRDACVKQSEADTQVYQLDLDLIPHDLTQREGFFNLTKRFESVRRKHNQAYPTFRAQVLGPNAIPAGIALPQGAKKSKADEGKDTKIRELMEAYLEQLRRGEFSGHPDDDANLYIKAATFYYCAYSLLQKPRPEKISLDIAWLGIDYLLTRKSRMIKHRMDGIGPAATMAPIQPTIKS